MTWGELRSGKDRVLSNADRATAEQAIAELLWNSLDAESTEIVATIETNELGAATKIVLSDNGTGIPHSDAHDLFLTEGDSWKKDKRFSPNISRPMHGQLGRGRLLVYSVAEQVEWTSCSEAQEPDSCTRYSISGSRSKEPRG